MHVYTQTLQTRNFTIQISPSTKYGYFECQNESGPTDCGLWFDTDGKTLIDFDGCHDLPLEVINALIRAGFTSDDEWQGMSVQAETFLCYREQVEAGRFPASTLRRLAQNLIAIGC